MIKRVQLTPDQIRQLITKPSQGSALKKAKEHEELLKQFYENSSPELVYKEVQPLLTSQKYEKFKSVFKNHAQTLVNRIERHFGRIYRAQGRVIKYDFGRNVEALNRLKAISEDMFGGMSIEEWYEGEANKIALTQPNSIYIVGSREDNGQVDVKAKHIKLSLIHDISADTTGIRYCIIKESEGDSKRFFVYDDFNWSVWIRTDSGIMLDPAYNTDLTPHNNSVCPATWAYNDDKETGSKILKKSIYSDVTKDLMEYNIIRTFYANYKYFSAFGRDIKPQTRCNYASEEFNVKCTDGLLYPIDPDRGHKLPLNSRSCPSCADKNTGVMGEQIIIPITQQANETLINNYQKVNFRIEADTTILEFHSKDIKDAKREILVDVIGEGYGESYKGQAINEDQVRSNFDDQESNLEHFQSRIEQSWEFILSRAGELIAPNDFNKVSIKLGDKYFLKTVDQLYMELDNLYKGTNNSALIEQKQIEILLTENRNNMDMIQRYDIVKALKPFSTFPLSYVEKNRATLPTSQLRLFDNFDQLLSIFESENGRIESMILDELNISAVIRNIFTRLTTLLADFAPTEPRQALEVPVDGQEEVT